MREGIEDYELLMESARQAREQTNALVRAVMPGFTDYIRDVAQFRKFDRDLLVLASEGRRK
jgi:chemotaxis methyl-accepting protein methylase